MNIITRIRDKIWSVKFDICYYFAKKYNSNDFIRNLARIIMEIY